MMMKYIFIFFILWGSVSIRLSGQEVLFEENFENWDTLSTCIEGWECGFTGICIDSSLCLWNRDDRFGLIGRPDSADCDGSGFYARSNTTNLQLGQIPFMNSPILDLSVVDSTDSIGFQFCFINRNSLPIDEDGIRISYSADSGSTWEVQYFDNSRIYNQWQTINLPIGKNFRTQGFSIKFESISGNSTGDLGMDDVRIINFSSPCVAMPFDISSNNNLSICLDNQTDSISFSNNHTPEDKVEINYIITDENDSILVILSDSIFDFNALQKGGYRVYGIAYVGVLQTDSAFIVDDLTGSVCAQLSNQFLSIMAGSLSIQSQITSEYDSSVSCNGARDAQINVEVIEGEAPFDYAWNTSENQPAISGLGAGTYTVSVSDANQCITRDTVQIFEPSLLEANANITSNYNGADISCNGAQDGSIFVVANGGTAPYSYLWSSGATEDSLVQLGARQYIVFVRDANGCVSLDSVTLVNPPPLSVSAEVVSDFNGDDISGPGATDGEALAASTGGIPPYNFAWNTNPPQLSMRASNLGAGSYSVTTVDQNGCTASTNIIVRNPGELGATAIVASDYNGNAISCTGANDGIATVIVSGGVPPFSYEWSTNPVQTSDSIKNLGPGTYTVTITDNEGVKSEASVTLTEPEPLLITANVQQPACANDSSGIITLEVEGGTSPFEYSWEDGSTNALRSGLIPGMYTYEVQDINNCIVTGSATVEEGKGIDADFIISNETCPGAEDGTILTILNSGISPFNFQWSSGNTTQDIIGIGAGTYWVRITDSLGCTFSDTLTISSLDSLNLSFTTTPDNGNQTGSADVTVSGGLPPYQYQWSTSLMDTNSSVDGLALGLYLVTVSDAAGCQISQQIEIVTQEAQCPPVHSGISPNGDGINDTWFIPCLSELGQTEIYIYGRGGQELLTIANYDNTWNGETDGNALPAGTYFYLLKSQNSGRTRSFKGTITIVR